MKKRIISFVLTLVMLFSCLSLEIFATENINAEAKMGVNSTNPSASGESLSASELADPIAEYFEKYGTIGKSGGFNLDSRAFENKVDGSNIILNTDFPTAAKYSNTNSSWSYSGLTIKNDKTFERIVPVEKDGNYYLQWHPTPIATKSTGAYFDNLAKNEDGTYVDDDLRAIADQVTIKNGTVYYNTNSGLNDDYITTPSAEKLSFSNVMTSERKGATYTVTFDIAQLTPGETSSLVFRCYSYTKKDFESTYINLGVKIDANGTLEVLSGTGDYAETGFVFKDGEWAQISFCHTPATNRVTYYVNGVSVATITAVGSGSKWTATLEDENTVTVDPKTDFTFYRIRLGQYGYGTLLDDLRIYWGENVEIASTAHENLAYSHKHDLANNKLILVATCLDEGCGVSETLEVDLCSKQGTNGLSVKEIEDLLKQMGSTANACCDFTDGSHGSLKFSNGTYKENGTAVIDWYMIADRTDSDGNGYVVWQRPVAKNPQTNKPFTEAEAEALSETARSLITFEDGVPYYTGKVTGEYVQYSFSEGDDEALKDLITTDPNNKVIGGSYAVTMDFTYYGGSFPFQILSNTANQDGAQFSSTASLYPFKIADGKLNVYNQGKTEAVENVTIPVGQTIQITFLHTPRGLDGKREVENGYSAGENNTFHIFIDGKLVATRKLLPNTSNYKEWQLDGTDVMISAGSDFTVSFIRMGQINANQANTTDLYAIDNVKIYRGEFLECTHSVSDDPNTCDWCHHEFDLYKCNLCQGRLLSEDVVVVGQSATLGEEIAYNVFLKLDKDPALFGEDTIVLDTTASGGTRKIEYKLSDLVSIGSGETEGLYKVSIPLRSIDMAREITVSLSSESSNTSSDTCCLNSYLDKLLETNQSYYVRQLVKAMQNYGAYAQIYFEGKNGNPEDLGPLPNASLSELDKSLATSVERDALSSYKAVITGNSVEIASLKLVLDSATELRILFRDGEDVTVTEGGVTLTKTASEYEGYSYVSLVDKSPATFQNAHTVVFCSGTGETTVQVSAYSVLYLMLRIDDEQFKNLASSMYCLGEASYEYRSYYVQGNEPERPDWDEDGVLKLLCIGNSFSVDAMEWIAEIATDLGYTDVVFGNLYIGGCYIDKHIQMLEENSASYTYYLEKGTATSAPKKTTYKNYTAQAAITSDNWDFISLQQGSARSYAKEHYANLPVLIDYVTTMCPNARLIWHQTWAYQEWYANEKFSVTQENMYKGIVDCVQNSVMTNDEIKILVPSGTAIQNARTSYLGDNLNRDGTHLDYGIGRYIAALTFFAALTGADISKVEWAPTNVSGASDVDTAARAVAIESVLNALKNPYEVTKSQYTSGDAPVDMTEYYDIIVEIANAYDRQGGQIPYDQLNARRSIYSSPEDATAQRTIYLDCSSFVNSCYREGFGANVLPFEVSEVSCSTRYYDDYAKENNGKADDVVGYWLAQECEDKAAVADWIEDNLRIGDILTYRHGKTEGTKGHTYIYLGDGVFMHCAGAGSYTVNTSNPALSYDSNASEVNGTIATITFDKIFRSESNSRYIFKATESDTVYSFGIIRPFARGLTPTDESLARMKIAGLSMEKTASVCENSAVYGGSLLTYIFTLENTGNALSGVTISDILPKGTVFVSGDTGVTVENGKMSWTGDVAQKSTVTVSYTVRITEETAGALIVSNESYVSGVKLGNIVHTVCALSEEKLAILAQTGIDFATEEREFASALDMIKTVYLNHGIDLFEYSTADEILDLLIDLENLTCYKDSELSDILAPNMYGGLSVRYGWLYFEAENDKVRLPKEENLFIGDIIVADWSGGEAFYLYVGNRTLLTVEGGVCKALTIGDDIFTPGDNIIISLLGYDRYAVLRPTMRNIDMSDITSISVTKLPDKLTYFVGEQFDATGMEVTATLENGSQKVLSYYEISPAIVTADTKIITVKVGDLTATFEISVSNEKFVYDDISKVLELDVNEVILVEGFVVGVAHEGKGNDIELLIKDVNDDDIIAVRGMSGSYDSLYGYEIGDRIRFSATVKKDKSTSTSYKLKKYLEYSADNGAIADTIISTGNEISYALNNVVEIDSWEDMQNFFKEDSNNTSAYTAPYTYLKISGGFYVHFYAGSDTDNYRIHNNADAAEVADIKPDAKRSVCIRDDVMNAIWGSGWQEMFTSEQNTEYPGTYVEKTIYVLYIGGNNSYYQIVILDDIWVSDAE